jgi:MFS family permease
MALLCCSTWLPSSEEPKAAAAARSRLTEGGTCELAYALQVTSGARTIGGLGRFQWLLLLASYFMNTSVMALTLLFSLVLEDVAFSLNLDIHEDSFELSMLETAVYFGWFVGAYMWGGVADSHGRRVTFIMTLALLAGAGMGSGLCRNIYELATARFVTGFAIGGAESVCFILLSEYSAPEARSFGNLIFQCGGSVGVAYLGLCGSMVLGQREAGVSEAIMHGHHASWRHLQVLVAAPATLLLLLYTFLPETPQWHLSRGETREAWALLKASGETNGVLGLPAEVTLVMTSGGADTGGGHGGGGGGGLGCGELLVAQQRKTTLLCWFLWGSCGLIYYGLTEQAGHNETTSAAGHSEVHEPADHGGAPHRLLSPDEAAGAGASEVSQNG